MYPLIQTCVVLLVSEMFLVSTQVKIVNFMEKFLLNI